MSATWHSAHTAHTQSTHSAHTVHTQCTLQIMCTCAIRNLVFFNILYAFPGATVICSVHCVCIVCALCVHRACTVCVLSVLRVCSMFWHRGDKRFPNPPALRTATEAFRGRRRPRVNVEGINIVTPEASPRLQHVCASPKH